MSQHVCKLPVSGDRKYAIGETVELDEQTAKDLVALGYVEPAVVAEAEAVKEPETEAPAKGKK